MFEKCSECDHSFSDDEDEYLYKGKSYCDDCYRAVKKLEAIQQENARSYRYNKALRLMLTCDNNNDLPRSNWLTGSYPDWFLPRPASLIGLPFNLSPRPPPKKFYHFYA